MATIYEILKIALMILFGILIVYIKWKAIDYQHSKDKLGNGGIQALFRYPWDKKL